jgi:uncharacterized protein (DUF488 family)
VSATALRVLTIGHSSHAIGALLQLLQTNGITLLADVRSAPYSRFNPQFNRETLRRSLLETGIRYELLGAELGGRSRDPACYENGRVSYPRVARSAAFRSGLARVLDMGREHRIALMCAEKEPLGCHRALLVAPALEAAGVAVAHVLADGRLEPHAAAMERLLSLVGLPAHDLFRSRADLVQEALARQAARVAYAGSASDPRRSRLDGALSDDHRAADAAGVSPPAPRRAGR